MTKHHVKLCAALLAAVALALGAHRAAGDESWEVYTPIDQVSITNPTSGNNVVAVNTQVAFACSACEDYDKKWENGDDEIVEDTVNYKWWCSGGGFSGTDEGLSVTWVAPATGGAYTVRVTAWDEDARAPRGDGSDDDQDKIAEMTMYVVKVDIKQGGNIITGQTQNTIVGAHISLEGVVAAGGLQVTNHAWTVPGVRIADYAASSSSATVTPLTNLSSSTVSFYWVDAGEGREVKYTATVGGHQFWATTTFNVKRPTCTMTPAQESSVDVRSNYVGGSGVRLSFGGVPNPSPPPANLYGVRFKYTKVTMPQGFDPGQWQYAQTVSGYNRRQINSESGNMYAWDTNGWVLDSEWPYSGPWSTGNDEHEAYDAPATPDMSIAVGEPPVVVYKWYSMDMDFKMYIMFKPAGTDSRWVPLKRVDWSWQGSATKDAQDVWSLDSGSAASSVGSAADETTHPEWSRSTESVEWLLLE